jgi:hypothetical protein
LTNIGNPDLVTFFSLFLIIVLDVGNLDANLGVIVMAYAGSFNENWGLLSVVLHNDNSG